MYSPELEIEPPVAAKEGKIGPVLPSLILPEALNCCFAPCATEAVAE